MAVQDAGDGRINDILLEMETIEHTFPKSIVKFEYPYVDGADLEDMGQKAHTMKVRCYFWDDGAEHNTFDVHSDLLKLLAKRELLELEHPVKGVLQGKAENIALRFNDRQRTAEIDLDFTEQSRADLKPAPAQDVESAVEASFLACQEEQADDLSASLSSSGFDTVTTLDPEQSIMAQIKGVNPVLRETARHLDTAIAACAAVASAIDQPANSIVAIIVFDTTITGRILAAITRAVERLARQFDSSLDYPATYLANLDYAGTALLAFFSDLLSGETQAISSARSLIHRHLRICLAQRQALEAAYCYADDENLRQQARRAEKQQSFDVLGRYTPLDQPALMNANELETTLYAVRDRIQAAINLARPMRSLNDLARALLIHVSSVKLERDLIITVQVDNPTPLHVLLLKYGMSYNCADRIMSINPAVSNPNCISGDLQVYLQPVSGS